MFFEKTVDNDEWMCYDIPCSKEFRYKNTAKATDITKIE